VRIAATLEDLLGDPAVEFVSICTPTDSHLELAERALAAGKHILVEKPVALDPAPVEALAARARAAGLVAMPAMCMRSWPGWPWLRGAIRERRYGELRSLSLLRIGAAPGWSREFYLDPSRSGDALFDLHIHDVDFLYWALGPPSAVESAGTARHVSTRYRFPGGPALVEAEGGWLPAATFPFRMTYRAVFESAVAEFDHGAEPRLRLCRDGGIEHPAIPAGDGYAEEIRQALRAAAGSEPPAATLEEAAAVLRILAAERESLARGGYRLDLGGGSARVS
jgi:predicted dehydrogenase